MDARLVVRHRDWFRITLAQCLNKANESPLRDGNVPVDNNHCENQMRPWAVSRKSWLFAGSELAGQRAAVVMSLVVSAKLNGHNPWAYLKDVLTRLPSQPNSRIEELLPHLWTPSA